MTTHTDLIARLRVIANAIADGNYSELTMRIPAEPDRDADIVVMRSALALESLEQQVAALTKERDGANTLGIYYCEQLAAAQARESKLREALELWKRARDNAEESELDEYACYCIPMPLFCDAEEAMDEALAIPTDDSALMERLKQERERIAIHFDNKPDPHFKAIAEAIRSMT